MRDKAIVFISNTVENYRRSTELHRKYTEERGGVVPLEIQYQQADTLLLWETILGLCLDGVKWRGYE